MTITGFAAAKGAPGVTTLVLALAHAWHTTRQALPPLVVEADLDGGSMAAGFFQGKTPKDRGLIQLALHRDADPMLVLAGQCIEVAGAGFSVLLGPDSPGRAAGATSAWPALAAAIRPLSDEEEVDVLIDLGRARPGACTTALVPTLDRLVWVMGSSLPSVLATRAAITERVHGAGDGPRVGVVVVGPGRPYRSAEIAEAVQAPLLGEIPHHRTGGFDHGAVMTNRFSPFTRAIRALAVRLQDDEGTDDGPVTVQEPRPFEVVRDV